MATKISEILEGTEARVSVLNSTPATEINHDAVYGEGGHSPEFVSDLFLTSPQKTLSLPPHYPSPQATVAEPHRPPHYPLPQATVAKPHRPPHYPPPQATVAKPHRPPHYPSPQATVAKPHRPPQYESISHSSPKEALRPKKLGAPSSHVHGSIQFVGQYSTLEDIVATWGQHLQVIINQVMFIPIEICAWLLAHQPGQWQQSTVIPDGVVLGVDGTGLDTIGSVSTATWGINSSGQAYFTTDGDIGQNESAQMWIDGTGIPNLVQ